MQAGYAVTRNIHVVHCECDFSIFVDVSPENGGFGKSEREARK
jgi:hypothetical protein